MHWLRPQGGTLQEKVDAMAAKRNHYSEHELLTLFQGVCLGETPPEDAAPFLVCWSHHDAW